MRSSGTLQPSGLLDPDNQTGLLLDARLCAHPMCSFHGIDLALALPPFLFDQGTVRLWKSLSRNPYDEVLIRLPELPLATHILSNFCCWCRRDLFKKNTCRAALGTVHPFDPKKKSDTYSVRTEVLWHGNRMLIDPRTIKDNCSVLQLWYWNVFAILNLLHPYLREVWVKHREACRLGRSFSWGEPQMHIHRRFIRM